MNVSFFEQCQKSDAVSPLLKQYDEFGELFSALEESINQGVKCRQDGIAARLVRDGVFRSADSIYKIKKAGVVIAPEKFHEIAKEFGLSSFSSESEGEVLGVPEQFYFLAIKHLVQKRKMMPFDAPEHEIFLAEAVKQGHLKPSERDRVSEVIGSAEIRYLNEPQRYKWNENAKPHQDIIAPAQHKDIINPRDKDGHVIL